MVRKTNRKIITQVIYQTIQGDKILAQAISPELKRFGLDAGLANYSASYATGLLCARRLLTQLGLADMYKGVENVDGELFDVYEQNQVKEKRPFKAVLDVGLYRTTTGNKTFAAMKGAVDGGLYIPHNTKRFAGYHIVKIAAQTGKKGKVVEKGKKEGKFDPKELREHIFGVHIQKYMDKLKKENKQKYTTQFSQWDKTLTKAKVSNLEALYKKVHSEIRKNPKFVKAERKGTPVRKVIKKEKLGVIYENSKKKWYRAKKINKKQKLERVKIKIQKALKQKK